MTMNGRTGRKVFFNQESEAIVQNLKDAGCRSRRRPEYNGNKQNLIQEMKGAYNN